MMPGVTPLATAVRQSCAVHLLHDDFTRFGVGDRVRVVRGRAELDLIVDPPRVGCTYGLRALGWAGRYPRLSARVAMLRAGQEAAERALAAKTHWAFVPT